MRIVNNLLKYLKVILAIPLFLMILSDIMDSELFFIKSFSFIFISIFFIVLCIIGYLNGKNRYYLYLISLLIFYSCKEKVRAPYLRYCSKIIHPVNHDHFQRAFHINTDGGYGLYSKKNLSNDSLVEKGIASGSNGFFKKMIIESNKNYTLSIYQKTNKIFQIESFIYFDNEAIKKEYSFFLNKEFSSVDSIGLSINYKKIKIDSVTIYNSKNEILFSEILENNHFVLARSLLENEITHNWELEAHHFINNTAIESYPMVLDTQMTCVDISKEIAELRNLIMINESGFDWNNLDSIKCDNTANDPESI